MILITGGSGSGKSAFAEKLVSERAPAGSRRTYLATMAAGSEEAAQRIARHRRQRAGQGFETVECPVNIVSVTEKCCQTVLLEDLGNLLANEMFGISGGKAETDSLMAGGEPDRPVTDEVQAGPGTRNNQNLAGGTAGEPARTAEKIFKELRLLDFHSSLLVVVTNEIFSDGGDYEPETVRYMQQLGLLNRLVAGEASEVWEVVCGIPVMRKVCGS